MKKFWKKHRITVAPALYVLIMGALFYFVIKPLLNRIDSSADKIQEIIINQENKEKRLGELPKLKEQFGLVEKKEGELIPLLLEDKAVGLIEKLEKIAEDSGNKITIEMQDNKMKGAAGKKTESVKKEAGKDDLRSDLPSSDYLEMKIKLSGNYNNFVKFVEKIEAVEFYSDIVSINIVPGGDLFSNHSTGNSIFTSANTDQTKKEPEKENNKEARLDSIIDIMFYLEK